MATTTRVKEISTVWEARRVKEPLLSNRHMALVRLRMVSMVRVTRSVIRNKIETLCKVRSIPPAISKEMEIDNSKTTIKMIVIETLATRAIIKTR